MTWIKFVRFHKVRDAEAREYREGDIVEMSPPSANHFIRRGSAVEIPAPEPPTEESPPAATAAAARKVGKTATKKNANRE